MPELLRRMLQSSKPPNNSHTPAERPRLYRWAIPVLGLIGCLLGVWTAGQEGLSRLRARDGRRAVSVDLVNQAVRFNPSDPEAHYARASVLSKVGRLGESVQEFERAVALRPHDHFLWLRLGHARDRMHDQQAALTAYTEAVRLAPYYAQPRWYLGHFLLRSGQTDEAFANLSRASANDPTLLPDLIDLAWTEYKGDAKAVQEAVDPLTVGGRLALARFVFEQGSTSEALKLFRAAGSVSDQDRRAFLAALLAARQFEESYEVWASGRDYHRNGVAAVVNGSFESAIILDDPGFDWQLAHDLTVVRVSLDDQEPHSGAHSLRVEFNGNYNPSLRIFSQLVLVQPNTPYRLSFAVRTQKVVTGGLPVVTVIDASSDDAHLLAQSKTLPSGTSGWQNYTVEFTTGEHSRAALINVQRQNCTTSPCPIFGDVWFDDFSLQKL